MEKALTIFGWAVGYAVLGDVRGQLHYNQDQSTTWISCPHCSFQHAGENLPLCAPVLGQQRHPNKEGGAA